MILKIKGLKQESFEEYRAAQGVSSHAMMALLKSPMHYMAKYGPNAVQEPPTPAMRFGTLVHTAVLEPKRFRESFAIEPKVDKRTSAGKAQLEEFHGSLKPGTILVGDEEAEKLLRILDNLEKHKTAKNVLTGGIAEASAYWMDANTGVNCKMRPDMMHDGGVIVDVKTTRDGSLDEFSRSIWNFGYHVQAAVYTDGYATMMSMPREKVEFLFVVIENEAPHAISVYHADHALIEKGREKYKLALNRYLECVSKDHWPGYSEEIESISIPAWAFGK